MVPELAFDVTGSGIDGQRDEMAGSVVSDRDCGRPDGVDLGVLLRASWASVLASRSWSCCSCSSRVRR